MKMHRRHTIATIVAAAVLPVHLAMGNQTKADNASNLDLGASWVGGTAPGTGDVAIWSGVYNTTGSLSATFTAGTPVSWQGIQILAISGSTNTSTGGLISIGGTGAAVTGSQVTLGSSGIDMSASNVNGVVNSATITINGSQVWNVSAGHALTLNSTGYSSTITGTGAVTIAGGGSVYLNQGATGASAFTGGWVVDTGATLAGLRSGAVAFGSNTSAGAITLMGGTLQQGEPVSGSQGNWYWSTPITLGSGFTSYIDEHIYSGTGRELVIDSPITGSSTANLTFKDTDATDSFGNPNTGYILTGTNTMAAGSTITIGGPVENGISGRLTDLRVGGINGTAESTAAGPGGSLGAANVVDNGVLTFSYSTTNTVSNNISGTGSVNVGGSTTGANAAISGASTQILTLNGSDTYTGLTSVAGGSTLVLATPGTFTNAYTGGLTIGFSGTNGTVGTANVSSGTNLAGVGTISVNSGTLNVASNLSSTGTLLLGAGGGTGTLNITAGTVSLPGIALNSTSSSTANLTLGGGMLNIGSSGITATAAGSTNLNLGAATVGASASWSSNQNFNLTDSTIGTTFNTTDAVNGTTARTITLSGSIGGSGLLNVTGNGKLYINGNDSSNGAVSVAGGATLGGTGSISGMVTMASGASLEGGQAGVGTLTLNGGLTFNGTANVNIGSPATAAPINDNGSLTTGGAANSIVINVSSLAGITAGNSYPLIDYSGGSIGGTGFSAFKLAVLPSRTTGMLTNTGSQIDLVVTGTDFLVWTGAGNLANGWDTSTPNWKLNSNGSPATYIDSPSPDSVMFDDSASPANTTVNLNTIVHPSTVTFTNSVNNYTFAGTGGIAGSTGLTMDGTGKVTLATSNSFAGPVAITAGITNVQNSLGLGTSTGATVSSGATLQLQGGISIGNVPLTIGGTGASGQNGALVNTAGTNTYAGVITLSTDSTISSDSGSLTLSSTSPLTANGNNLTLTGAGNGTINSPIAIGGGSLNLTGSGLWTLTGSNSFTGQVNVTSGTLGLTTSAALASSSGINLGTSNSGSANIGLNISGGVTVSSPITVLTQGTGSISLSVTGNTTATVSGALSLSSGLTINNGNTTVLPSAFTGGTLPYGGLNLSSGVTGTGGLTFTGGGVTVLLTGVNTYSGQTLVTGNSLIEYYSSNSTDPNTLLNISSGSRVVVINSNGKFGGLTGSGPFTASTQTSEYETIGYLNDPVDSFSGVIAGPLNLTKTGTGMQVLSGSSTYTGTTTVNAGILQAGVATVPGVSGAFGVNTSVTVSGGTLDLNSYNTTIGALSDGGSSSGLITLGSADLTIASTSNASFGGMISGSGRLIIKSSAVQTLTGSNTYTGATNISSGTLVITTPGALPTGNNVFINTASTLVLDSQTTASSANRLNVNGNLIVHNGSLQTLTAAVQSAASSGWNGATGIISTAAAGNTLHLTAVGIIQNDDGTGTSNPLYTTFEGQSVGDSDVLVKYTYYGDTNLDGKVDGSDYSRIDSAFLNNQTAGNTPLTGWFNGDFNYDGVINGSDYTLIDNAFNTQGAQFSAEVAEATAEIAPAGGSSAVPEPASLAVFGLCAIGLLGRRRRRA